MKHEIKKTKKIDQVSSTKKYGQVPLDLPSDKEATQLSNLLSIISHSSSVIMTSYYLTSNTTPTVAK